MPARTFWGSFGVICGTDPHSPAAGVPLDDAPLAEVSPPPHPDSPRARAAIPALSAVSRARPSQPRTSVDFFDMGVSRTLIHSRIGVMAITTSQGNHNRYGTSSTATHISAFTARRPPPRRPFADQARSYASPRACDVRLLGL